jgi:lipoprotein-releasing system permease protein
MYNGESLRLIQLIVHCTLYIVHYMTLPFFIARRYFFSRQKRSFIHYLSILAMLGVGVGTMALVVVLSVFNGMEDLNRQLFKSVEADLSIGPVQGKRFTLSATQVAALRRTPGVQLLTGVAADNALARYADGQTVVRVKGVDSTYLRRNQLDSAMLEGRMAFEKQGYPAAIIARGVQDDLTIAPEDILTPLELYYPERGKRLSSLNPDAFRLQQIAVAGVFFIEATNYDNLVMLPLAVARDLLGYAPDEYSALEIQRDPAVEEQLLKETLQQQLSEMAVVSTRDELNKDLFRAISYEKIFTTITISFIILIAGINTFFSLSMLALEKKQDIGILGAMGATPSLIRRIFLTEGAIISLTGATVGLAFGLLLCYLQQKYGLVGFGTASTLIDAYPVRVRTEDILLTGVVAVVATALTSYFPAQRAAQQVITHTN